MLAILIVVALIIALLSLWTLILQKRMQNELAEIYVALARLADNQINAQKQADEAQQKLYEYMDLTRKESLDSYRKGLQDGLTASSNRNLNDVESRPIKPITEHIQEIQFSEALQKAAQAEAEELAAMFAYTGDMPNGNKE